MKTPIICGAPYVFGVLALPMAVSAQTIPPPTKPIEQSEIEQPNVRASSSSSSTNFPSLRFRGQGKVGSPRGATGHRTAVELGLESPGATVLHAYHLRIGAYGNTSTSPILTATRLVARALDPAVRAAPR